MLMMHWRQLPGTRRTRARPIVALLACLGVLAGVQPVLAHASGGRLSWVARFSKGQQVSAADVAVSADGTKAYVTGTSNVPAQRTTGYETVAYEASTGEQVWERRFNGPGNDDEASAIAVSSDNQRVFVTGSAGDSGVPNRDYLTVAYDAVTGSRIWARRYDGRGHGDDLGLSLAVSPDNQMIYVAGSSEDVSPRTDVVVAYDAVTGARVWVERYGGTRSVDALTPALGVSPDGSMLFVTFGSMPPAGAYDYVTVAIDASTGSRVWARRYDGPAGGDDASNSIGVSLDGATVFVGGSSGNEEGSSDYATVAYDAISGSRIWVRRLAAPGGFAEATALSVDPDEPVVFVTGLVIDLIGGPADYATVAYDAATGSRLWMSRYDGTGHGDDIPLSIGVSSTRDLVVVTGWSLGATSSFDYATAAYDSTTGARSWAKRYDGSTRDDRAVALAMDPEDMRVFVTGTSRVNPKHSDAATVAYRLDLSG
jgi:glucose dehydrogenase